MNQLDARALFERLVAVPDAEVDLVQAALALAAEDDDPFDLAAARHRIDGLARQGLALLPPTADEVERLDRLNELLFDELAFSGDDCDFDDPASSFLNRVVERRTGLPIALSVLYVHVGRQMGLACFGVGFPGHFLAKVQLSDGEVFVDPFRRIRSLDTTELERRASAAGGGVGVEQFHIWEVVKIRGVREFGTPWPRQCSIFRFSERKSAADTPENAAGRKHQSPGPEGETENPPWGGRAFMSRIAGAPMVNS